MNPMLEYFQRVVALSPGTYFSVHYKTPGGIPGIAFQDFALAEKAALAWAKQGHDVYLGMGAQAKCEPDGTAIRQLTNTVFARCLCMDIDVKATAYASTQEAMAAYIAFRKWLGLPPPTVVVLSGTGGFHPYDRLSELITLEEHQKLSRQLSSAANEFGLKFDQKCTTDAVHLLRVPGTLNFKVNPPAQVVLHYIGNEIDINVMRKALANFKFTPASIPRQSSPNDDLRSGKIYNRAVIDQVAEDCPFIRETLDTGGANLKDEPQWHDMMALACHCVDPSVTAHRLCSGSQYYDHDGTEQKLEVAQRYREQNPTLGPPKCVALQGNGAPQCVTCPHLALNTTPLTLPFRQAKQLNGHIYLSDLPSGYFRDNENRICIEEVEEEGDKPERVMVFPYVLAPDSGYLEDSKPMRLTFTTWQGEEEVQKTVDASVFADRTGFSKAFLAEGLSIPYNLDKARMFFMHYIQLLQSRKATMIRVPPLGWTMQNDIMGFAYDGEFVTPKGKFPCQHPSKAIANYRAIGDVSVWKDMAQMVLTPDRPDLMVLAATAFSAPLVKMSGQHGYLLGAWSIASGIGKTTALILSQSTWTEPVLGGFTDTVNYTFAKCAELQDLPVIYDEVKGEQQTEDFVKLVFQMTGGKEKGRADRNGKMRETRTWHTNIPYAANSSIVSAVADKTQGTHASVYRMFEFEALDLPNKQQNFTTDMARLTTKLSDNYGGIGKIYAQYLGENYDGLRTKLLDFQTKLEQDLVAQQAERCWIAAISTTLCGAMLAKALGLAPFDVPLMKQFMLKEFWRMRHEQQTSTSDYSNPDAVYSELAALMAEKAKNTILLDRAWTLPKKPPKNYAKILNDRPHWADEIGIQISGNPLTLRIRETFFTKWCGEHKKPRTALANALEKLIGATRSQSRIASGTPRALQSEWVMVIPVTGTPLEDRCEYAIQHKDILP